MDLVDKREDDSETEAGIRRRVRRRRLLLGLGAGTVFAAGVAALLIARPWADDADVPNQSVPAAGSSSSGGSEPSAAAEPELSNRLLLLPPPAGFVVQYVNDPSGGGGDEFFDEPQGTVDISLFREADATYAKGPWLSVSVSLLDRFERRGFQPFDYVDQTMFRKAKVNGLEAAIGENFDESRGLLFGPVNDGFAVSIAAIGVSEAQLLAIAEQITLEEDGDSATPVFGAALTVAGLEPFVRYTVPSWGGVQIGVQLPGLFGGDPSSTNVGYATSAGFDEYISITNQPLEPDNAADAADTADGDPLDLARFVITDRDEVTVHGLPAITGTSPESFGESAIVVWVEGGRLIVVTASPGIDSLVEIAESVGVASQDEWAAAIEQWQSEQGGFEESPETWLLAAGDLEDAATWLIEGGLDGNGELVLCAITFTGSSSSSGCAPAQAAATSSILQGGTVGFNGTGVTIVALGPLDETVTLRYTTTDGDLTEVVLRVIRPEWEYTAGALLPTAPGTAELIGADGRVIATKDFSTDEFEFDASGDIGVAPAETAVPAQG